MINDYYWRNLKKRKLTKKLYLELYATWYDEVSIFPNLKCFLYARGRQAKLRADLKQIWEEFRNSAKDETS